jgi:hypothetical protein
MGSKQEVHFFLYELCRLHGFNETRRIIFVDAATENRDEPQHTHEAQYAYYSPVFFGLSESCG